MELRFVGISKKYKQNKALSNFSCDIGKGVHALLGPNGSGKSTLMNILTQNLRPDCGQIFYNNTDTNKLGALFREKIGFMPQTPRLYPGFTAFDFLMYMASLKGLKKPEAISQIDVLLERLDLSDIKNKKISTFSGGMKQRIALAQAILGSPEILILDEPSAGLDPRQRISMRNLISEYAVEGCVLIATHIVPDIENIATNVIFLKKGVIASIGSPDAIKNKLSGRVWTLYVSPQNVPGAEKKYKIINIANHGNRVMLRVISDTPPGEGAESVLPELEDCYFDIFEEKAEN